MRILIASSIDKEAVQRLRQSHDVVCSVNLTNKEMSALLQDREALIFRSGVEITTAMLSRAPGLKLLIRAGCGIDNLDLKYVEQRGIELVRIPEPAAMAVAEMAVALMLALARNLREADRLLRQGHWAKHELEGHLLSEKTLGIVGAGNIGSRTGQLGAAIGMNSIGCVEHPSPRVAVSLAAKGIALANFDDVITRADFLSIHVPLTNSTRNLIDAGVFARMKRGAFLINLARGGVVDEMALHRALQDGHLRGAALDVHEHEGEGAISPLAELPNVVLTPHIGAATAETQRQIGQRVVEIIDEFDNRTHGDSKPQTVAALGRESALQDVDFICETE